MTTKFALFDAGYLLTKRFCEENGIRIPAVVRLVKTDTLYHLATCAYYRPETITIMVEKCASLGYGGRAWSWPGYAIDRTPYGVLQHELGHHVDSVRTGQVTRENILEKLFSRAIYEQSKEPTLTGYLGTDTQTQTFFMEWFAENFRLFVTNPDLCRNLRPKFYKAMRNQGINPVISESWKQVLINHSATDRIIAQAKKKITV